MKVFYDERQNVAKNDSPSPSAGKPALAVESWKKIVPVEIMPVTPVTQKDLCLIHDPDHVSGILNCIRENGFENRSKDVADSLLWNNGSFVSAARYAVQHRESVVSPTSGFHHATYNEAMGFCTFNGLMLAAVMLKQEGLIHDVAIADIDMHYGNGTDDIISRMMVDYVRHYTFGKYHSRMGSNDMTSEQQERFLTGLPKIMDRLLENDPQVLFYQAGADPHVDDPHGGVLTTEQLKERDRIVFQKAKDNGVPVVWNLAGGYQSDIQKVLEIHDNTALMHVEIFDRSLVS